MRKRKIGVIGHFGYGKNVADGQSIKTKMIYESLKNKYGEDNVFFVDTHNWKKRFLIVLFKCLLFCFKCSDVIILPAQNSVKIMIPLFVNFNIFHKYKVHYIMIGGWLPEILGRNIKLTKKMKKVDYIYSETKAVKKQLNDLGLDNIVIMKNFKNLSVTENNKKFNPDLIRFCIFSRIEKLKGIDDAIFVVKRLHDELNKNVVLDIYGSIKDDYREDLFNQINEIDYINYCGVVDFDKSVETIENYNLLLFPTLFVTEGIPGTIIDSYFAGVPVVSSKWNSFSDVVVDGKTGIGYDFANREDFFAKLSELLENGNQIDKMSENCKAEALKYTADNSLEVLFDRIGGR